MVRSHEHAELPVIQKLRLRENHIFLRPDHPHRDPRRTGGRAVHPGHQGHHLPAVRNLAFESALHSGSHADEPGHGIPAGEVFPGSPRQRSSANRSRLPSPAGEHTRPCGLREVSDRRALHRFGPFHGTRRAFGADWGGDRFLHREVVSPFAGARSEPGAGGRGGSSIGGVQYPGCGRDVRAGRDHRRHERGLDRLHGRGFGGFGDRRTFHPGQQPHLPGPAVSPGSSCRTDRVRGAWDRRWHRFAGLLQGLALAAGNFSPHAETDPDLPARHGRSGHRRNPDFLSPGDGRRLRVRGPGAEWRACC